MSERARKVLERWRERVPALVERGDVEAVLETFLPGAYRRGGKEHWSVEHEWLRVMPWNSGRQITSIATVKGRHVKSVYVKHVLALIDLREWVLAQYPHLDESAPLPQEVYNHYESEH